MISTRFWLQEIILMEWFQTLISDCELIDMAFKGPKFTWWNHQEEVPICKLINRVLINANWRDAVLEAFFLQTRWSMKLGAQRKNLLLNKFIFIVTRFKVDSSIWWYYWWFVCSKKKDHEFGDIIPAELLPTLCDISTPSWSCSRWDNSHSLMSL